MENHCTSFDELGNDLIKSIFNRLPAKSLASAASVSRSWNHLCSHILSYPRLSSVVSFNPSLEEAVKEVVDKILSKPLRPHFALLSVAPCFVLREAVLQIELIFGSKIPILVNVSEGIIGRDMQDKFVQVNWPTIEINDKLPHQKVSGGILLTVGYLPGLKVHLIPLFRHKFMGDQGLLVESFITDIRAAVSDSTSLAGILLFGGWGMDIKSVLQTIEYVFPENIFVAGDGNSRQLMWANWSPDSRYGGVGLIFTKETKASGIGETRFNLLLSSGISPVGPTYMASCEDWYGSSCVTGTREKRCLGGDAILEDIRSEVGEKILFPEASLYLGVTKSRRCSIGIEIAKEMQFHEFHKIVGSDEEYLVSKSYGIETGDNFRFYIPDSVVALSSSDVVSDKLKSLKLDCNLVKEHVFGCILFSCRDRACFGHPGRDSSSFLDKFPGVNLGGTFCGGEIGRGKLSLYDKNGEGSDYIRCDLHCYSCVYLVMSYRPPPY